VGDYDDGGVVAGVVGSEMLRQLMEHGGAEPSWQQRIFALGLLVAVVDVIVGGAWLEMRWIKRSKK
jgi:uncharacterized protein YneF (UPF0154 family)